MDLNKGISTPIAILLIVIISAVVGVLVWQFKPAPEAGPEPTKPQATTSEEEPTTEQPSDYTAQSTCEEAGYYWYSNACHENQQEESSEKQVLKNIRDEVGCDFTAPQQSEIRWRGEEGEVINGYMIEAKNANQWSGEKRVNYHQKIKSYLEKRGFQAEMAGSRIGASFKGYKKENLVCVVSTGLREMETGYLETSCGLLQ